jgi:hypothetical protein
MKVKNLAFPFDSNQSCKSGNLRKANFFKAPYSERDILRLQDLFLIAGFHEITVVDSVQGRELIEAFLTSLHCFYWPAYFSTEKTNNTFAISIDKNLSTESLEVFFYNNPQIDFLWIEFFDKAKEAEAGEAFIDTCRYLQLERKMPILIVRKM